MTKTATFTDEDGDTVRITKDNDRLVSLTVQQTKGPGRTSYAVVSLSTDQARAAAQVLIDFAKIADQERKAKASPEEILAEIVAAVQPNGRPSQSHLNRVRDVLRSYGRYPQSDRSVGPF